MRSPKDLIVLAYIIKASSLFLDSITHALTQRQHRKSMERAHLRDDWHSIRIENAHWSMSSIEVVDDDDECDDDDDEDGEEDGDGE